MKSPDKGDALSLYCYQLQKYKPKVCYGSITSGVRIRTKRETNMELYNEGSLFDIIFRSHKNKASSLFMTTQRFRKRFCSFREIRHYK